MNNRVSPIGLRPRGFTLIETLVSVAIFSTVMVVALGALLSLSEANRRAELLSSATNNFDSAIDSMSRAIRTGINYHCGAGTLTATLDCTSAGSTQFAFLAATGNETVYQFGTIGCPNNVGCILRSTDGGASYASITSPEIFVKSLKFFGLGAFNTDNIQPRVVMLISGYVVVKGVQKSVFNFQTSVTQRFYDR